MLACCLPVSYCLVSVMYVMWPGRCHTPSPLSCCLALANVVSLHLFHTALPWPVSCRFTSFILPCPIRLPCLCCTAWPVSYCGALHESNLSATSHPVCQLQLRYHGGCFSFSPYPQLDIRQSCLGLHTLSVCFSF